ncbi:hypothetical protein BJ912DRAFT_961405 [Pholiota molesta]|nr:hypothetical protein BJ912DRAFT_961405 [Pholiota molesta]
MVAFTILAGGFSTFIATYVFNTNTSSLTLTKQTTTGDSPSWIASHLQNSSILYATNEISPIGNLQSFLVDADGGLTLVDTVATGGSGPTFTNPLSTGEVSAMNFGSPNCTPVVNIPVNGGPSNPHMSLEHNGEVFVSDLGADKIWRLVNDGTPGAFSVQGQIDIDPGSGPRHMAIRANSRSPNGTTFPLLANVSIVPTDVKINGSFAGAEIILSEPSDNFPDPLIYVSNRNLGPEFDPRGDSIAIFNFQRSAPASAPASPSASNAPGATRRRLHSRRLVQRIIAADNGCQVTNNDVTGNFTLQAQVFTGLRQIRSMAVGKVSDGGDEYLIAGANVDGGVAVFQRVDGGRNLQLVARNTDIANRTSFVFV